MPEEDNEVTVGRVKYCFIDSTTFNPPDLTLTIVLLMCSLASRLVTNYQSSVSGESSPRSGVLRQTNLTA